MIEAILPLISFFILLDFWKQKRRYQAVILVMAGLALAISLVTDISAGVILFVAYTCYWGFQKQAKLYETGGKKPWRRAGTALVAGTAVALLVLGLPQNMSQPLLVILALLFGLVSPPVVGMWANAAWATWKKKRDMVE